MTVRIKIADLRNLTSSLLLRLENLGHEFVDIPHDSYFDILAPMRYEEDLLPSEAAKNLKQPMLSEDWEVVQKIEQKSFQIPFVPSSTQPL